MRVRDRMTANPITVQPQTSVNEALRIMQGRKIRRLPVVQDGRLVGAVTHVFVNDPTRGYGTFAEWMLREVEITGDRT